MLLASRVDSKCNPHMFSNATRSMAARDVQEKSSANLCEPVVPRCMVFLFLLIRGFFPYMQNFRGSISSACFFLVTNSKVFLSLNFPDLPQAQKASLARFLEKRRERFVAVKFALPLS